MNEESICIKNYQDLIIKGNTNSNSKIKELISVNIYKCEGPWCAKENEINSFINGLRIKRIAIQENIDY